MNAQYLQLIVSPRSYIDNNLVIVVKSRTKERLTWCTLPTGENWVHAYPTCWGTHLLHDTRSNVNEKTYIRCILRPKELWNVEDVKLLIVNHHKSHF